MRHWDGRVVLVGCAYTACEVLRWLGVTVGFHVTSSDLDNELRTQCKRFRCPLAEGTSLENPHQDVGDNAKHNHHFERSSTKRPPSETDRMIISRKNDRRFPSRSFRREKEENEIDVGKNKVRDVHSGNTLEYPKESEEKCQRKSCDTAPPNPLRKKKKKIGVGLIRGSRGNSLRASECMRSKRSA